MRSWYEINKRGIEMRNWNEELFYGLGGCIFIRSILWRRKICIYWRWVLYEGILMKCYINREIWYLGYDYEGEVDEMNKEKEDWLRK